MAIHMLDISKYAAAGTHLGPAGAKTAAVWLWGCPRSCPGCIAADWNRNPPAMTLSPECLALILADGTEPDCIVLSGGEPLRPEQINGVDEFLHFADEIFQNKPGIMIYTGYTEAELRCAAGENPALSSVLARADILVDGAYVAELDDDQPYRGSSNQHMLFLSDRYSEADFPKDRPRTSSIRSEFGEMILSGIPSASEKSVWYALRREICAEQAEPM